VQTHLGAIREKGGKKTTFKTGNYCPAFRYMGGVGQQRALFAFAAY
jgi:hypothetical protein